MYVYICSCNVLSAHMSCSRSRKKNNEPQLWCKAPLIYHKEDKNCPQKKKNKKKNTANTALNLKSSNELKSSGTFPKIKVSHTFVYYLSLEDHVDSDILFLYTLYTHTFSPNSLLCCYIGMTHFSNVLSTCFLSIMLLITDRKGNSLLWKSPSHSDMSYNRTETVTGLIYIH